MGSSNDWLLPRGVGGPLEEKLDPSGGVNLRSHKVNETGIEIVGADGRAFRMTHQEILDQYKRIQGTNRGRQLSLEQWLAGEIQAALGVEQINLSELFLEVETNPQGRVITGRLKELSFGER
jgi:hypothetical protein